MLKNGGSEALHGHVPSGIDPNSDQTVVTQAFPHPEYGCSLRRTSAPSGQAAPWFGILVGVLPLARLLRKMDSGLGARCDST